MLSGNKLENAKKLLLIVLKKCLKVCYNPKSCIYEINIKYLKKIKKNTKSVDQQNQAFNRPT